MSVGALRFIIKCEDVVVSYPKLNVRSMGNRENNGAP